MAERPEPDGPNIGLFATCLVDLMRPSVGFAAARLLEAAGCRVVKVMTVLDRHLGGSDELRRHGYDFHALLEPAPDGTIRVVE